MKAAFEIAALGYRVFPCDGKQPARGCLWREEATTDPMELVRLFRPGDNIGLIVGPGQVVLDLDRKPEADGIRALAELSPNGWKHTGPRAWTGTKGLHLWFRVSPFFGLGNGRGILPAGIDVRGGGKGYVVAPPSIHPVTRSQYVWATPLTAPDELPELPGWLLQLLLAKPTPKPTLAQSFPDSPSGRATESYLDGALKSACDRIVQAAEGSRNQTLNNEAYSVAGLFHAGMEEEPARAELHAAALQAGLTEKETAATIRSAFRRGADNPRRVPETAQEGYQKPRGKSYQPDRDVNFPELRKSNKHRGEVGDPPPPGDADAPPSSGQDEPEKTPSIYIRTDELRINDEAVAALARRSYPDLYQRNQRLVTVVREADKRAIQTGGKETKLILQRGTPSIKSMSRSTLRERLADSAYWWKPDPRRKGQAIRAHPPEWSYSAILDRGEWRDIPRLRGIADYPLIRADGSFATRPGYDPETGYYLGTLPKLTVPEKPSPEDVERSKGRLLELVQDFPFRSDRDRAAWVVLLLTPIARAIIDGPTPLFLVEANVRGAGKTLLTNLVGLILTGRELPAQTYSQNQEELEKVLVSIARLGLPVILFDNVRDNIGGATLDKWLTSTQPSGRILGHNDLPIFDWNTVVCATANNAGIHGDTDRRTITITLETDHEKPETRTDFQEKDIRRHILLNRARYLEAALTILRGFLQRKPAELQGRNKGTFEHWCAIPRDAAIRLGLPDCERAPDDPDRPVDRDTEILGPLVAGLLRAFGEAEFTVGEVVDAAFPKGREPYSDATLLREALSNVAYKGDVPSRQKVGRVLKRYRNRWISDAAITSRLEPHKKQQIWRVKTREGCGYCGESAGIPPVTQPESTKCFSPDRQGNYPHDTRTTRKQGDLGNGEEGF